MKPIVKKSKAIGINSFCNYFEKTFVNKSNYPRIGKQYLKFLIENGYGIDEISLNLYIQDKSPTYKTACRSLVKFAEKMGITQVFDDESEKETVKNDPAIELFLANKQLRASSKLTYSGAMKELQKFLAAKELPMNRASLIEFLNKLIDEKCSPYTLNTYLSVYKQFAEFCIMERDDIGLDENTVKQLRDILLLKRYRNKIAQEKYAKDALTAEERDFLLESITNLRDKALIALMALQGLRTVETLRLEWTDILEVKRKYFLAVLGKGVLQKEKIPLIKKCHDILLEYKKTLPDTQKRIFAIEETRTVRQIVAKWFKITKLNRDKLSAHSLRHTTAQVMIYEGVPKAMVKRFLRHQSELSTNVYTGKQEDANFLSFEFEQKEIGQ